VDVTFGIIGTVQGSRYLHLSCSHRKCMQSGPVMAALHHGTFHLWRWSH